MEVTSRGIPVHGSPFRVIILFLPTQIRLTEVVVGCLSGILSEMTMKSVRFRVVAQMAHNRWACLIVCMAQLSVTMTTAEQWHLFPFGGWTWTQVSITLVDCAEAWLNTLLLKRMNSVWKVLGSALSLSMTYILSSTLFYGYGAKKFSWEAFLVVTGIALLVLTFASSKRDESKLLQLKADADRHILQLQQIQQPPKGPTLFL
eukprot:Protomagalhaensia_sp_Gyna_25__2386@NODE_2321_length_1147_cov_3_716606_g1924_i0_p1_GENE_NODE_2321_length_1147_cov_3_716606_g1924_i0NODE_2321_length_1147_cov_3_716606_g1924_i0_p1_ORF_typecomplete_len203_score32_35Nuc_sug_transp/PF04142_15/3_2e05Phage_holin_2_3/PF16080_5/1_1e04Phage_holin_2_3/PF16080_5/0_117TM7TMR_HD/PF07698_11/2_4e027TM7TMR_HD/PF07698_11/3_NODE_2321_length_1147_cov_3_716606_g1924_i0313921